MVSNGRESVADPRLKRISLIVLLVFWAGDLAYGLYWADAPDVVVLQFLFSPLMIAPAILGYALVRIAKTKLTAQLFFVGQMAAITSSIWLWTTLYMHPDAQNGIAKMLFPFLQLPALAVYAGVVMVITALFRHQRP